MDVVKTLSKSIREFKGAAIQSPLFVVLESLVETIIPFVTAKLINEIKAGCGMETITKFGIVLIILATLSLSFGVIAGNASATAATGFSRNLRKDIFYKIQDFSFENIDRFQTSSLVTRMTTDIQNVQLAFMMLIRIGFRAPMMLIFSFATAFIMGGRMAWIFVAVIPILGIGLAMVVRTVMPLFRAVFKKYDALNDSVQENVTGMRVVKSFVREEYEKKKFDTAATDVQMDFTKAERILAINNPLMQFCLYVVMIFVLSFGSYLIISTKGTALDVGQFSALLTYSFQILISLMMLSMIFVMVTISAESAERIAEVLKEESTLTNPENPVMEVPNGSIDFDNVSFKYSKKAERFVLSDIDLHIKSGETIGIIGGTGSSKSSIIQLIPRLYDVTEGTVSVGGLDVKRYDLKTLRDQVAVVLQKNVLFSGTIKENLRWGNPKATDEEIIEACKLAQADEFVQGFPDKYDTFITQGGTNVSGGQKQRLCIARALLKKPKVLILDDSTSAVDTKTDALIRKGFKEFIPETTKIIIAQRVSSVQDADRILILAGGKIQDIGNHDELLSRNTTYQELYKAQNKMTEEAAAAGDAEENTEGGVR
ncbi:ABC transporter ATP-binding protein [Oribacterium sp. WCC10]|uniref:ABC transporter ATP-binding protein n=1 Tax=Oribacterium sp. WCC10 TaxID=1855343 RepID=UPI0008F1D739|nr:ABC transporter ATP-binding protein [Oribacterium sp. WCC10]SFG06653.1 ATP-binding cassette, subfamily B [Oribacterium sp. WCC10]